MRNDNEYFLTTPRIYQLGLKGYEALANEGMDQCDFVTTDAWHDVGLYDFLALLALAARKHAVAITTRQEVFGTEAPRLTTSHGEFRPDEFITLGDCHFVVEYDNSTENITDRANMRHASVEKKLKQCSEILKNGEYKKQWGLKNVFILFVFRSQRRAQHSLDELSNGGKRKSQSMCFIALPDLGSRRKAPPISDTLLDEPWMRAGHAPITILSALTRKEVHIGYSQTSAVA
jgi:hypothetical protein